MGDYEDDYDDDFYFEDDGYLYVEDSFAIAVSAIPENEPRVTAVLISFVLCRMSSPKMLYLPQLSLTPLTTAISETMIITNISWT
jgi:hypothetical protein